MLEGTPKPVTIKMTDGTIARGVIFVSEGKRISDIIKNSDRSIVMFQAAIAGYQDRIISRLVVVN